MVAKDYHKSRGSAKAEVGEIDTSAPFQSVKDAVILFGEAAFSGVKPPIKRAKAQSAERALAKEMQLHLAQKEMKKLKEQLTNAETTKAQALIELERAKNTVEDLTQKLKLINDSKYSAISATEMAKQFAEENGSTYKDLETSRIQYLAAANELDAAKQELSKIRLDFDAFVEAKDKVVKQAYEAEISAKSNMERAGELSKEIASVQYLIQQVKLASIQADEEKTRIVADKDEHKQQLDKIGLDELVKNPVAFKKDNSDPELIKNLETELCESESLAEGDSLRNLVETLKAELDNTKKEHSGLKEKEVETESVAGNLHVKLRKAKSELVEALTEEAKARGASDEMIETIHQLALECENTKLEAEKMKLQAEELKKEAEATRIELEEAEKRLRVAIDQAEEAKAAEVKALDRIQTLSETTEAARASTSESGAQITVSRDEYESLSQKAGECEKLAEIKVGAIMAQVEAVKASENEAMKRLEAIRKEIEGMKAEKEAALKKAEMAEAARKAVEGELRRWHEREQKKAAEEASRVFAERERSFESSPLHCKVEKQRPQERVVQRGKLEKAKTYVAKKVMMPRLSGVLNKKKNEVEGELSSEKHDWGV